MKKSDLQNEKLDRASRRLLEATRVSGGEIEKIVASPSLFAAVQAGIKAERQQRQAESFPVNWRKLTILSWRKTGAALAVLALFTFAAFGLIILTKQNSPAGLAEKINPPEIQLPIPPVEMPQPVKIHEAPPEIDEAKKPAREKRPIFQKAAFKNENIALPKAPRKKNFVKRQTVGEPENEFYALTYTGKPVEPGEHLKIIRAELSRSSLFALGVNLPIENESEKIKTDLLVGADGIAKAIRFVK